MKNFRLIQILSSCLIILTLIILSLLAQKERVGYLSEFSKLDNTENNTYNVRIKYNSSIFRNSDLFGVYPISNNLPNYINSINWDVLGSPFGVIHSTKEITYNDTIDIGYKLKLKTNIYIYALFLLVIIFSIPYLLRLKVNIKKVISAIPRKIETTTIDETSYSLQNENTNFNKVINILFYCFIAFMASYCFLLFFGMPISFDDWVWGGSDVLDPIYFLKQGWHPGRNISEVLTYLSMQSFGILLGNLFNSPILGVKLATAIMSSFIIGLIWVVSYIYVKIWFSESVWNFPYLKKDNVHSKIIFVSIILFFFFSFWYNELAFATYFIQIKGGLLLALTAWLPFLYFFRYKRLPDFMTSNKVQTYGIMLVVFYIGTQVTDSAYFMMSGLSSALIVYLLGQRLLPNFFEKTILSKKENNFLLILLFTHLGLALFALFRNTYLGAYDDYKASNASIDPQMFFASAQMYMRTMFSSYEIWGYISIALIIPIIFFSVFSFIRCKKITLNNYAPFAVAIVSLILIIALTLVRTYVDNVLWVLWLCEFILIFKLYKKNPLIPIMFPTILLAVFVHIFIADKPRYINIAQKNDYKLVQLFQDAEQNELNEIVLTEEEAKSFSNLGIDSESGWKDSISEWMKYHGYTKDIIKIRIDTNNINK